MYFPLHRFIQYYNLLFLLLCSYILHVILNNQNEMVTTCQGKTIDETDQSEPRRLTLSPTVANSIFPAPSTTNQADL